MNNHFKHTLFTLSILIIFVTFYSCNIINPTEGIPAILRIEKASVETDYELEGTDKHNITDVWVFAGNEPLGVFPLPATIPILNEGSTEISIFPGVKLNNQAFNRNIYEVIKSNASSIDLIPGDTSIFNPVFKYKKKDEDIYFDFINNFDFSNDFESQTGSVDLKLTTNENIVFEGARSLTLVLDDNNTTFNIVSLSEFKVQTSGAVNMDELPVDDRETYLEMHYKIDAPITVNIIQQFYDGANISISILNIGAVSEWTKIYIPLRDAIVGINNLYSIRLSFAGIKPTELNTARFSWDNIKLVHEHK